MKPLNQNKMKEKAEMTRKELIALGWVKKQSTAVEFLANVLSQAGQITKDDFDSLVEQAKEMEKEQRSYSEEDVRLAYFQGEKDSYIKGGQTKEMENEFIQSLKQKHELNKLDILLCGEFIQDPRTTYSKCMCGRYFWEHPTKKSNL